MNVVAVLVGVVLIIVGMVLMSGKRPRHPRGERFPRCLP